MKKLAGCFVAFIWLIFPCMALADITSVLPSANPVLQVTEYEVAEGSVELASEFQIVVTVKNQNLLANAYNVSCSVSTENIGLRLADGEVSQSYYQEVEAGDSIKVVKTFYLDKEYPYANAKINYTFRYIGEDGREYENTTFISPEVRDASKLKITGLIVPERATLDSRTMLTVKCTNEGALAIKNLTMNIEGEIVENEKNNYLGDIKSGEDISKNIYINFNRVGKQQIHISFSYTDETGATYETEATAYDVEVLLKNTTSVTSSVSSDNGIHWKMVILMSMIVIIILYMIRKLLKSMKKGANN